MHEVGIDRFAAYQDFLEVHPDEFGFLFNTILINVTGFFRDTAGVGVPRRGGGAGDPRGEEARRADPALERGLRLRRGGLLARDDASPRRWARTPSGARQDLRHRHRRRGARHRAPRRLLGARRWRRCPPGCATSTSRAAATRSRSAPDLRRSVIFGRHDLVQAAPISRIDLLVCRNVLMYLNAETQSRVLARLPLRPATRTGSCSSARPRSCSRTRDLFVPLDLKQRIFRKAPGLGIRQRLAALAEAGDPSARMQLEVQENILEAALDAAPAAMIVVDSAGMLALANKRGAGSVRARAGRLRPPAPGPRDLLPPARAAVADRGGLCRAAGPSGSRTSRSRCADGELQLPRLRGDAAARRLRAPRSGVSIAFLDHTPAQRAAPRAGARPRGPRALQRGAPVRERGARDHQRGAAVDERGAGDDQRGAPVGQRGARDDERGAPVHQRGAAHDQRAAPAAHPAAPRERDAISRRSSRASAPRCSWSTGSSGSSPGSRRCGSSGACAPRRWRGVRCSISTSVCRSPSCDPRSRRACAGETKLRKIELDAVNRRGAPIRCAVTCTPLTRATRSRA